MLTHAQIKKVSRLQHQVGELRPGFLKDGTANLEGPANAGRLSPAMHRARGGLGTKAHLSRKIKVAVTFERDPQSGEMQLVQL